MPMPGNFKWRPNDNSSQTNLRYDLEAEKWIKAVNNAKSSNPKVTLTSFKSDLSAIFTILSVPLLLFAWVILVPIWLLKEIVGFNIKLFPGDPPTGWIEKDPMAAYRVDPKDFPKPEPTYHKPSDEEIQKIVAMVRAATANGNKSTN